MSCRQSPFPAVGGRPGSRVGRSSFDWRRLGPVTVWLAFCLGAASLTGQSSPTLTTDVDSAQTTMGGRITLTIRVQHGEGERVVFPDSLSLDPFEVLGVEVGEPEPLDDRLWSWARYTLTVFELGELEIPSFEVALVDAAGGASVLETHPYGVVVASVGLDETGDIRDVKSPLEIPLGLLVLLLVALLYALYRRFRQQPAASPIDVSAPLRRPYEVAYDQLRELEASGMLERGEIKDYYIRVSEIIRAYVEAQYYVPALEMASFEVLENLEGIGVDHDTLRDFEGFLAECDLVKFAKFVPDASRARQIVPRARKLVERTKVGRPAPVGVAAAVPEGAAVPATDPDEPAAPEGANEGEAEDSAEAAHRAADGPEPRQRLGTHDPGSGGSES